MRHYWHDGHDTAWTWIVPGIFTLLFGLVLIGVLVLLWRAIAHRTPGPVAAPPHWQGAAAPPTPEQVLAGRLASGEIDVDEYRLRVAALRGGAAPPPPPPPSAPPPPPSTGPPPPPSAGPPG
ncbi:SHOCT domain-containing protein [Kitasatospora indigofera]|uniref:SHOCT domain-containing protein n=1 Tax=Kitasatospora indigofera TaxID=67307 RepID=UPI0036B5CBF1